MNPFRLPPSFSPQRTPRCNQQGFSLVELMIAITIGFIVVGAVGYLYISASQSFRTTDNMSRMQENARLALETISRDVRMAGFVGCGNLQNATINTIANPPVVSLSAANGITGTDFSTSTANYVGTTITRPAGDSISITGAFKGGVSITGNLAPSNANIQINGNPLGFAVGDVLMVSSCINADIFSPTSVSSGSGTVTMAHGNSTNTGNRVGTYGSDGAVYKMDKYTYFIGTNPANNRALYRTNTVTGTAVNTEELVENVWDMQIEYGMDTDGDGMVDVYASATGVTNWAQVQSARISLLMVSPDNNIVSPAQTYNFNHASVTSASTDKRMYQVWTSTIAIRNRAP
jgi:type IV pilus assembly protein PilW